MEIRDLDKCDKIDIIIKSIVAKLKEKDIQIFFQEMRDPVTNEPLRQKEPVTLFIDNAGDFNQYPLECIECVRVQFTESPSWSCICGKKIKVTVPFRIFLVAKFTGWEPYELIVLPDDIGVKVTTLYDLSEKQVSNSLYQTLQRVGDVFIYTIIIPFEDFVGTIPEGLNFTVVTMLRNMSWEAEIGEVCFCGTGSPPVPATRVDLSIFYDLLIQILADEELTVLGEVD